MFAVQKHSKDMSHLKDISYNLIAYSIYIPLMLFVTFWIGRKLHKHGTVYLNAIFKEYLQVALAANDALLIAYYLLNIGYTLVILFFWEAVATWHSLVQTLSFNVSLILLVLAGIHFCNIIIFALVSSKQKTLDSS